MPDLTAKRTLVKSPPELWEELSEVDRLAKHLGAFGDIKITKLEPEHTVAWEADHASGTVSIEPSGWGTKVTLHAELPETKEPPPDAEPEKPSAKESAAEAEPGAEPEPEEPTTEKAVAEAKPAPAPLTAEREVTQGEAVPEPAVPRAEAAQAVPVAEVIEPVATEKRRGFFGWLFRTRTAPPSIAPEPVAARPEPEQVVTEPEPTVIGSEPIVTDSEPMVTESQPVAPKPEPVTIETARVVVEPEPAVAVPEVDPVVAAPEAEPVVESDPEPVPESPVAEAPPLDPERARSILDEALDALGAAHHRPFSRG